MEIAASFIFGLVILCIKIIYRTMSQWAFSSRLTPCPK